MTVLEYKCYNRYCAKGFGSIVTYGCVARILVNE